MPIPKNFRYLLFLNLMSEFEAVSSICSQEKVHLEMLQSGWLRAFWSISQGQDFSYYRICVGTQFMTKIFFKFKKPYFWPIFGAKSFFQKPWLCHALQGGFSDHAKIHLNVMIQDEENTQTKDRGKADRLYFIGSFQLPPATASKIST